MAEELYCAAPNYAGVWHRFRTLNNLRAFVKYTGYRPCFLWGVSEGVSHCKFEELLAPIPGFQVLNVTATDLAALECECREAKQVTFNGRSFQVYRGGMPKGRTLAFDLTGTFSASTALQKCVPKDFRWPDPVRAMPSAKLAQEAQARIQQWDLGRRVGVRVRVTECPIDGRPLGRMRKALDDAVKKIIRMPWHVRVFLVTDSEYVQQMLVSHFRDIRFLSKKFPSRETGGGYIDRQDASAMRTFMVEIACLSACSKVINLGGFLNQETLETKIMQPPFDLKAVGAAASGIRGVPMHG